jgi:predicted nicotinamide N-methyase
MDWRNPGLRPAVFDFIWAGDILYETRFCQPLTMLLKGSIRENGRIWIADPERNISDRIWSYFEDNGFIVNEIKREKAFIDRHGAMVRLMELSVCPAPT